MESKHDPGNFRKSRHYRVTMRDVADRVGVSHVTVSLALRNHPSISETRRIEIKRIAGEMGYVPDPLLASLAVYRRAQSKVPIQNSIAWINRWEQSDNLRQHREFELYWRGAQAAARRFGYHLEEFRWSPEFTAKRFEKILLARNVRGLLIPPHRNHPAWEDFDWNKFSVIRFGLSVREPDTHLVTSDQLRATIMAMEAIHRRGYRKIGFVLPKELDRHVGGNYIGGFYAAQRLSAARPVDSLLLFAQQDPPAKRERELGRWLKQVKPDAVLTGSPQVPDLMRKLGYRIPQDIGVAATSVLDIPVDAGIDQQSEIIGRIAVETLVVQISANERGQPPAPCRILVESIWQQGESLPLRKI